MIAEYLCLKLVLTSWSLNKPTCEDIQDTGFKKNWCFFINRSDRLVYFFIGWEEIFVIGLSWQESITWS